MLARLQVDARALREMLEPMACGALEQIKAMLLQLTRDLCREKLEVGGWAQGGQGVGRRRGSSGGTS